MKVKNLVLVSLFAALIAVGAFIKVPVPVCPFTLQVFFTALAGILLGSKLGSISVIVYVVLGLIGVPVFASGGGLGYVFQPTFGYLLGFIIGTYVTGKIVEKVSKPSFKRMLFAAFAGLSIIYLMGMIYYWMIVTFYTGTGIGLWTLLLYCFLLCVPGDSVLCILAAVLGKRLKPILKKNGAE